MKKIFISLVLALLPLFSFAQTSANQKIGLVNTQLIFTAMPETKNLETELEKLAKKYEDELLSMQKEYQKKYEEFVNQQDTLIESIKVRKQQEIQDMAKRIQDLNAVAQQDMQKKQLELMAPIQKKLKDAINKVATTNGYAYVLDANQVLFIGSTGVDLTNDVKKSLGI